MIRSTYLKTLAALCALALGCAAHAETKDFNVPGGALKKALSAYVKQAGVQLVYKEEDVRGLKTQGVNGPLSPEEALEKLLTGTQLVAHKDASGAVAIVVVGEKAGALVDLSYGMKVAQAEQAMQKVEQDKGAEGARDTGTSGTRSEKSSLESGTTDGESNDTKGIPEVLVKGSKITNADIERTEDDAQPYIVFDREQIERSHATNLEEFLRKRLPMNTMSVSAGQGVNVNIVTPGAALLTNTGSSLSISSGINLRGLGANQTLILIDGRRVPGVSLLNRPNQPDINGVPLGAIERIEVLPSTAGGIHGGSATGGVINIVLRKDYKGLQAEIAYGDTFDGAAVEMRFDLSGGLFFEGGRTNLTFAASHTESGVLTVGERDFSRRARQLQLANNPSAITGGEPPLGATVNIRSNVVSGGVRQNLTLKAQYGGTNLGSTITHVPLGYLGIASDNAAALIANAGQYNLEMAAGLQGGGRGLIAAPTIQSVLVNLRRQFTDNLEAFLDLSTLGNHGASFHASEVPFNTTLFASAPSNPFQQNLRVSYPTPGLGSRSESESTTERVTGGLILRLPSGWVTEFDYGWSRSRVAREGAQRIIDFAGGTSLATGLPAPDGRPALNLLQEQNTFPVDFSPYLLPTPNYFEGPYDTALKDLALRFSGPLMDLPGGSIMLSGLVERREETIENSFLKQLDPATRAYQYTLFPRRAQEVDSYYLEARAPVVTARNAHRGIRSLELQASVRRDQYKTAGHSTFQIGVSSPDGPFPEFTYTTGRLASTDYTAGIDFAPIDSLRLRGSYGTGFLPPSVTQLVGLSDSIFEFEIGVRDPKRGNTDVYAGVPFVFRSGGAASLRAEKSESWSAGLVLTPSFASELRISVDYTSIEKVDELQALGFDYTVENEDLLPGRVERGPNLSTDPADWAGPISLIDLSLINIAKTVVKAVDFQMDYVMDTERFGSFHWYGVATYQPTYENQTVPAAPSIKSVGFDGGPLEWRANAGLIWRKRNLELSWDAQYYDSYAVHAAGASASSVAAAIRNQGSSKIPGQHYHDLVATYRFDGNSSLAWGILADTQVSLAVKNVFDKSPPIIASVGTIAAGYSTYGDPKLRRYSLTVSKSFGGSSR